MIKRLLLSFLLTIVATQAFSQESWVKIADDVEILKLQENVYLHRSYFQTRIFGKVGANGLILVSNGVALMVDTPWNNIQTEELFNRVSHSLLSNIKVLVVTHWHEDRMGGLDFLTQKGVKSYANYRTIDIAKKRNLPLPQNGFSDSIKIDLDNIVVECFYLGAAHTSDNIVVWLPEKNVLFGGCSLKDINSSNLGNLVDADVESWVGTMRRIKDKFENSKLIIPGHGDIGGYELIQHTAKLLDPFNSQNNN